MALGLPALRLKTFLHLTHLRISFRTPSVHLGGCCANSGRTRANADVNGTICM
jgi:hypothetical protein